MIYVATKLLSVLFYYCDRVLTDTQASILKYLSGDLFVVIVSVRTCSNVAFKVIIIYLIVSPGKTFQ